MCGMGNSMKHDLPQQVPCTGPLMSSLSDARLMSLLSILPLPKQCIHPDDDSVTAKAPATINAATWNCSDLIS